MGKLLYIRVNASTYDETKVRKEFPTLCELVWNEKDSYIPAAQFFGVLELIATLHEALEYANFPQELVNLLKNEVQELVILKENLSKAITSWEVREADKITYDIEEKLQVLEAKANKEKILKLLKK